ncbi:MAG: hypothetical protein LBB89_10510 [Treponema sp.]|nr:hypothetical protein [Treponema sp.]
MEFQMFPPAGGAPAHPLRLVPTVHRWQHLPCYIDYRAAQGSSAGVAKTLWDSSTEQTREQKQKLGVQ